MSIIKKWLAAIAISMTMFLHAGNAFEFVNSADGYSYIQINENLESFTFTPDWHSLGNAGRVGYIIYTADMSDSERAAYMEANANNPEFGKKINGGVVSFGPLNAGDKVGFYEERPNGGVYTHTSFEDWKDEKWLAFDKNGGYGKDEWMSIGNVETKAAGAPNGAPIPGALAILLVGSVGAGCLLQTNKKKVN